MSRKKRFLIMIGFIIVASLICIYLMYVSFFMNQEDGSYDTQYFSHNHVELSEFNQSKRVLYISSYLLSFETFNDQLRGIRSILPDKYVYLDVEFMDTKRFNTEENINNFYLSLSYKLSNTESYDGIIVADDNGLRVVLNHYEELFNDIPIIFLGINSVKLAFFYCLALIA